MNLTFLGQAYEATANEMAPISSEHVGQYRGAVTRFSTNRVAPRANVQLTYRGVAYVR